MKQHTNTISSISSHVFDVLQGGLKQFGAVVGWIDPSFWGDKEDSWSHGDCDMAELMNDITYLP